MRIVKRFNDADFKSLQRGVIRIGSLAYYRRIESSARLDITEGPIGVLIHAREVDVELSGEQMNRINKEVGARYRLSTKVRVVIQNGSSLKVDSDVNVFVFCTSMDALKDEALSQKFGQNVIEVVDAEAFSKLISAHLRQKVIVERCLNLTGNADSIGGAYEPISYREKTPRALCELKGGEAIDMSGVFVKPRHLGFEEDLEFRFAWIPLWSKDGTACDLPVGFEYLDLDVPEIWTYLRVVEQS